MKNTTLRPGLYYASTFVATFAFWLAGAYLWTHRGLKGHDMLLMLPGLLAPLAISVGMVLASKDKELREQYINRLFNVRLMRVSTFPALLLMMPMVVLSSALISLLFGESVAQFRLGETFSGSFTVAPGLLALFVVATVEEFAWRSYAFDSLESRHNSFRSTILFSVLWSLWYLPLLLIKGTYPHRVLEQSPWYALNFYLSVVPLGVIVTWFWLKNRKSIISAVLIHIVIAVSQAIMPLSQVTRTIETGLLAVVAAAIVATDREIFYSRGRPVRGPLRSDGSGIRSN